MKISIKYSKGKRERHFRMDARFVGPVVLAVALAVGLATTQVESADQYMGRCVPAVERAMIGVA